MCTYAKKYWYYFSDNDLVLHLKTNDYNNINHINLGYLVKCFLKGDLSKCKIINKVTWLGTYVYVNMPHFVIQF